VTLREEDCAFHATCTAQLKGLGFEGGHVWVGFLQGRFEVIGEKAGRLSLMPAEIVRARFGYDDSKRGRHFQIRLWRQGDEKSIDIYPTREHWGGYARTVRLLAARVAATGGLERVERGTSKVNAWLGPLLMAIPTSAGIWIAVFVIVDEPWWGRLLVPVGPLIILTLLIWHGFARAFPRPVKDLEELKKQLP
jgi:hypothetical protein